MREDQFTNTEHDAALYEQRRGQADDVDDRPTRGEAERDECEHDLAWLTWPLCPDCGEVVEP